jgi:DNA-binding XRE family transcriptional regulator
MKNNIAIIRNQSDISIEQLSAMTGISIEDLKEIEKGQLEPTLIDAYHITKSLKKDLLAEVFIFDDVD